MVAELRRGDVVWVELDIGVGSEIHKARPAIVISNDGANLNSRNRMLTVLPLSHVRADRKPRRNEIVIPAGEGGLRQRSATVSNQVRSVDRDRVTEKVGSVSVETLKAVDQCLQRQLALV